MADAHPDTIKSVVRQIQVGRRYEITPRSVYLLNAALSFYKSGEVATYPYTQLSTVSALNAVLATNPAPDEQRNDDDLWFLTISESEPFQEVIFPEGKALYFPYGLYVTFHASEAGSGDMTALLRASFVDREDYCPARTSPAEFAARCGAAPSPGPSVAETPWTNNGTQAAVYLQVQDTLEELETLGGDPIEAQVVI